tara:strand:+ start:675 stop:923 length:249 start_codon:yes stop_codon:yes gene_type:complete
MAQGNWHKIDRNRYENTVNGAFIAVFEFGGKSGRTPCVYLNKKEYQGGHSDYRSAASIKEAKAMGDKVEELGLIRVHTKPEQ